MLNLLEEQYLFDQGFEFIGAIDEAGRGPLAGPVVAACVIFDKERSLDKKFIEKTKDSKKLAPKKREEIFDSIFENFLEIGVGVCDHETIDRINILEASFLAMKKAIGALKQKPEFVILDGKFPIPNTSFKQRPIVRGDSTVFSIAAASIIAKVTRDRMMLEWHEKFPDYSFDRHKGYGTRLHMELLQKHGPCMIHRKSFGPVKRILNY